ncbi:hypothetical protein P168DRAFT_330313 [Aspergillus campestris IBT 28561]|uniref:Uncharacterized protein n=1 Tax=Aspergillus campestris (strain IBT 28561) TaxID=1392248 RepID=A0A2I1CSA1_ASPC2|nr:uncharacterized protein P168DRAFT_330313 [Aspergillus campestris IBT 28561]PKY00491.1 hypothetical protein P168DRAFT_330313 [Aspergillus campestris IBT 28561]
MAEESGFIVTLDTKLFWMLFVGYITWKLTSLLDPLMENELMPRIHAAFERRWPLHPARASEAGPGPARHPGQSLPRELSCPVTSPAQLERLSRPVTSPGQSQPRGLQAVAPRADVALAPPGGGRIEKSDSLTWAKGRRKASRASTASHWVKPQRWFCRSGNTAVVISL